jgi:hypothetical protein
MKLSGDLAREQRAFLRRGRAGWDGHLERIRGFLGDGLRQADPDRPVLILGAGSGLEVPWALAPPGTAGWDGDPWSRVRTAFRHHLWPPWCFEDLTGGLEDLAAASWRGARQTWSGQLRKPGTAAARVTGLIRSLRPQPAPLRRWLDQHRPATILAANVMGQFGVVAQRLVERAFGRRLPWEADPDLHDPLEEAVEAWTRRALEAFLAALADSGADLWLCHDRGVVFSRGPLTLGPLAEPWTAQLRSDRCLEVSDPLCGLQVPGAFPGRILERHQRWLWELGPGQRHVMEALRVRSSGPCRWD